MADLQPPVAQEAASQRALRQLAKLGRCFLNHQNQCGLLHRRGRLEPLRIGQVPPCPRGRGRPRTWSSSRRSDSDNLNSLTYIENQRDAVEDPHDPAVLTGCPNVQRTPGRFAGAKAGQADQDCQ